MCNQACIDFATASLLEEDVRGRRVLEVGALDVNGSVKPSILNMNPVDYWGVDLEDGPGVDERCDAAKLVDRFGSGAFDVVISTELLEHVPDWRLVVSNMKHVLAPNGVLVITTRSLGYPYHAAPRDFWRFEVSDMEEVFADLSIDTVTTDPLMPGVFMKARKPLDFRERDLSRVALHSMVSGRRVQRVSFLDTARFRLGQFDRLSIAELPVRLAKVVTPQRVRRWARQLRPSARSGR